MIYTCRISGNYVAAYLEHEKFTNDKRRTVKPYFA